MAQDATSSIIGSNDRILTQGLQWRIMLFPVARFRLALLRAYG